MKFPSELSIPGLLLLIAIVAALTYLDNSGSERVSDSPASTETEQPAKQARGGGAEAPGNFDYYALVLSWSPTHCETPEGKDDETQCGRGRRYGFILHGLWPQYDRGFPENCPTQTRPYVPKPLIDDMMDIMPSKRLIIHEYRKHGTCSGLTPEGYFNTARRLFAGLRIPDQFRNPAAAQFLGPSDVVDAFVEANPKLGRNMMAVACRGPGDRFREVRVCFSKTGELRACGNNENQRQLCRSSRMHVPPVR